MALTVATVTGLKTYQLCPRKFQYAYVDRLPADQVERSRLYALGDLLRASLMDWYAGRDLGWPALDAALLGRWDNTLFRDSGHAASQYHRARQMLWEKFTALASSIPVRQEYGFDLAFGGGPFRGRIARIDDTPDGLVIGDYRVDRGFDPGEDGWPLHVYAAVARRLFQRPAVRIRVLLLGSQQADVEFEPAPADAVETQIARLRRAMSDDRERSPRPGRHCVFCAYNQVCEAAWSDARTARRPNEMLRLFRSVEELVQCGESVGSFRKAVEAACGHLGPGTRVAWRDAERFSPDLERVLAAGQDLEGSLQEIDGALVPAPGGGLVVPVGRNAVVAFPDAIPRGAAEVLARSLRIAAERMENLLSATTDGLTGLARREVLERRLASIPPGSYALVLCDIDHFKRVNDTRGHDAGDEVLRSFGRLLAGRAGVAAHRLGGEEFCLLVPRSDTDYAAELAEMVRVAVEGLVLGGLAGGLRITSSFGVASSRPGETGPEVLKRADEALYRAKETGRNRVEVAL